MKITDDLREASRIAWGGQIAPDTWIEDALSDYGNWMLWDLRDECEAITRELEAKNPDGGPAWGIVNQMNFVIAVRDKGIKW